MLLMTSSEYDGIGSVFQGEVCVLWAKFSVYCKIPNYSLLSVKQVERILVAIKQLNALPQISLARF